MARTKVVHKASKDEPQRFYKHIEGPLKQLPDALGEQLEKCIEETEYVTHLWPMSGVKEQHLDMALGGRWAKYMLSGEATAVPLEASRFRVSNKKQIIVVGLPGAQENDPLRYIVIQGVKGSRAPLEGGYSRCRWKIWRGNDGSHYEGLPETIFRIMGPAPLKPEDILKPTSPTASPRATPEQDTNITPQASDSTEHEPADSTQDTVSKKRKLPPDVDSDPTASGQKTARTAGSEDQNGPRGLSAVTDDEPPSNGDPLPQNENLPTEAMMEKDDLAEDQSNVGNHESERIEVAPTFAQQEKEDQQYQTGLAATGKTQVHGPLFKTEDEEKGVVDLVNDREMNFENAVQVTFIDKYGHHQHTTSFARCQTAEALFEEACALDAASKYTKMLEIRVQSDVPTRLRKNDRDHFDKKIMARLDKIKRDFTEGDSICITVRHYM